MSTFIHRFEVPAPAGALRVAVKDLIDVAGTPTTAGSKVVAATAEPATADAACLAGIRAAEAIRDVHLVGKTNLHELAFGVSGVNPWFGTPPNPLNPAWVPGGSSSGSATAVGHGEADVALGTDTGGSIRIPAACCGVVGLKTTWGRIPLGGVRPLAPSLDTVGPMAATVDKAVRGMQLLEPGFAPARSDAVRRVGRVRLPAREDIDRAIDQALAAAGFDVVDIALPGWEDADGAAFVIMIAEAWEVNGALARAHPTELGADVMDRLDTASRLDAEEIRTARRRGERWKAELESAFDRVDLLALPALAEPPPVLVDASRVSDIRYSLPVNLAGVPAVSLPVPMRGPWPAALQLLGPTAADEAVVAAALRIEAATASVRPSLDAGGS